MKQKQAEVAYIISCRWCGKKVLPDAETLEYPKNCPNKSCRRRTWNKSDSEIIQSKKKSVIALLKNHKDGKLKKLTLSSSIEKWEEKIKNDDFFKEELKKEKNLICKKCELMFADEVALKRHQDRRGHK